MISVKGGESKGEGERGREGEVGKGTPTLVPVFGCSLKSIMLQQTKLSGTFHG